MDIVEAMKRDAGVDLKELKVDGGASRNNLLMQFQANVLSTNVIRPKVTETTALGAAYLAGLAVGYWESIEAVKQQWQEDVLFSPTISVDEAAALREGWKEAVGRTLTKK